MAILVPIELRLPQDLARDIKRFAEDDETTEEQWMLDRLREAAAARDDEDPSDD